MFFPQDLFDSLRSPKFWFAFAVVNILNFMAQTLLRALFPRPVEQLARCALLLLLAAALGAMAYCVATLPWGFQIGFWTGVWTLDFVIQPLMLTVFIVVFLGALVVWGTLGFQIGLSIALTGLALMLLYILAYAPEHLDFERVVWMVLWMFVIGTALISYSAFIFGLLLSARREVMQPRSAH